MATNDEDKAFTFPGDDEPAFDSRGKGPLVGESSESSSVPPDSGAQTGTKEATHSEPDDAAALAVEAVAVRRLPASVLIFYGVVGGWMLLYTVGWVTLAAQSWSVGSATPLLDILSDVVLVLMAMSPALWMLTAIVATRGKRVVWTAVALLIGIVLLMPWPYFIAQQVGA